jgi:pilus assembly protein CpaF
MALLRRFDESVGDRVLRRDNGDTPKGGVLEYVDLKMKIHRQLIEQLDLSKISMIPLETLQTQIRSITEDLLAAEGTPLNRQERDRIVIEVEHEVFGLGPIEPLMRDPTISDILVNGAREVYVERRGMLERTDVQFRDDAHLMQVIERIVSKVGRRVDESTPIRRFAVDPFKMSDLLKFETLTPTLAEVLEATVKARLNMMISGGTGTGKTTLLNVLSNPIPNTERIVTIEDSAELQLQQDHVVRLETRPPNIEGKGGVTQRDLVRNALRMRPDRIIVGEVRGAEALDMLQAMNTGHDGSVSTIHANSTRDALSRIETMVLMAGVSLPSRAMREYISSALDLLVHLARMSDGTRKIVRVTEVVGMEGDTITLQDIFIFDQKGIGPNGEVLGHHRATGIRPRFADRLKIAGIELNPAIFEPTRKH